MERIAKIFKVELKNIKNVKSGIIDFKENITGLYGQNGSGKTALVDSMNILKNILCGKKLDYIYDLIGVDTKVCGLKFHFDIETSMKKYKIILELSLKKLKKEINGEEEKRVLVEKEIIKYSEVINEKSSHKKVLIGSTRKELLKNVENFKELISKKEMELKLAKILSEQSSVSFLFSNDLMEILKDEKKEYEDIIEIINLLKKFGLMDLIVISNENMGVINLNTVFPLNVKTNKTFGSFIITDKNIVINEKLCDELHKVINQINVVLNSIIPNMKLELFEKNKEFVANDKINVVFQLISIRNNKKIPFKNESDGIKKIVSILSALIAIYNDKKVCLVIDELDSGIFEYLLGELLSILEDGTKGQLIFTSHNLRILEKLHKDSIVFTTTNENNRYIRLKNIKPSNNLRDVYIREMTMQEQNEKLYEETNNGDIEFALYEAGVLDAKK
ncbi:AAA family ATPase [Fusobacterium perfoetens]|uniref:AAA family ATPase n=1 Tax=Fusobacterium perfoetens TaxID=852 RepID=UPI0004850C60|nr:AAA family ATPase [Fusobacterium perfoetens]